MGSIGALIDGTWTSRHEPLAVAGSPATRATPRMFGHEAEPATRVRRLLGAGTKSSLLAAGLLADENLPAAAGTLTYRFRASISSGNSEMRSRRRSIRRLGRLRRARSCATTSISTRTTSPRSRRTGPVSPGTLQITFVVPQPSPRRTVRYRRRQAVVGDGGAGPAPAGRRLPRHRARARSSSTGGPPTNVDLTGPGPPPTFVLAGRPGPQDRRT